MNIYSHEKINDRLYIFTEGYSTVHRFTIGVIIGDQKILVIDAGIGGDGKLREYIESVVENDKPLLCAVTHGHIDHVGSACLFDERYCNSRDYYRIDAAFPISRRLHDIRAFSLNSDRVVQYCEEHIFPNETAFQDVQDGDIFALGGVSVQAIALPGHSAGSMAYYSPELKVCFTGDGINTDVHVPGMSAKQMRRYGQRIARLIGIVGEDCTLYPAHLNRPMTIQVARNIIQCCEDIADGRIEDDPMCIGLFQGSSPDAPPMDFRMHYVGNACIFYERNALDGEGYDFLKPDE